MTNETHNASVADVELIASVRWARSVRDSRGAEATV